MHVLENVCMVTLFLVNYVLNVKGYCMGGTCKEFISYLCCTYMYYELYINGFLNHNYI